MSRTVGEIMILGANFAPEGWMQCNGASLNVADYQELYAVIGILYGGVIGKTFNLPNKAPIDGNEYFICVQGAPPETMLGLLSQIKLFAGETPPRSWIKCDGRLLPIKNYETLYSLLGNRWGGDGETTFGIPTITTSDSSNYLLYTFHIIGLDTATDSADLFVSEIGIFPITFQVRGCLECNGQVLPIQGYTALYSLIGNRYPDGHLSFNLPSIPPIDQCLYQISNTGHLPS